MTVVAELSNVAGHIETALQWTRECSDVMAGRSRAQTGRVSRMLDDTNYALQLARSELVRIRAALANSDILPPGPLDDPRNL